jgi:hypothetical protein
MLSDVYARLASTHRLVVGWSAVVLEPELPDLDWLTIVDVTAEESKSFVLRGLWGLLT